jgi:hypothetical protein
MSNITSNQIFSQSAKQYSAIQRILHFFTFSHAQFPPGTLSPRGEVTEDEN